MCEWELHEESGQQRLDALGGTFWLSENMGWTVVKVAVDAAGPNLSKPIRFASAHRAKEWVQYLIDEENQTKN